MRHDTAQGQDGSAQMRTPEQIEHVDRVILHQLERTIVPRRDLREPRQTRAQRRQGEPVTPPAVGKALTRLCAGIEETRPRNFDGGQTPSCKVPPPSLCRGNFAAVMIVQRDDLDWEDPDA